jgi:hypothetical protein
MKQFALDSREWRFASATVPASEPGASNDCPKAAARPWRCRACGALLGMERDGELHVKYKEKPNTGSAVAAATGVAAAER